MRFVDRFAGGECDWPRRRPAPRPRFTFRVRDLPAVQGLLRGMFVELAVRPTPAGPLAFCLDVPDRELGTWSIPLREGERLKLARTDGECEARLRGEGAAEILDLTPFVAGLRHDWSGGEAAGFARLAQGDPEGAARLLAPLAARPGALASTHHLLGRCHRALGRLEEAIACYRAAISAGADAEGRLRPWAAGALSDMGVAYKRMGDAERAMHCFLHSLHLRPNHPEALLSFFSLLAEEEPYVLFGAARVLAIGGREDLVEQFLANYARFAERPLAALRAEAQRQAEKVDLLSWPFSREGFGRLAAFERGLRDGAAPAAVRSGRWGPGTASA